MIVLENHKKQKISCAVFDFDGTLSTLRCGWETVMEPLMLECIFGEKYNEENVREVREYIKNSTGIQTILQMKWLAERVRQQGKTPLDPWDYKAEYNRRLMENVSRRVESLVSGSVPALEYLIAGSEEFLRALCERGVRLYVASGTDHPDVCNESAALGLQKYFTLIAGAPVGEENCSKEKVMAQLLDSEGLHGDEVAVIGDGKVEIRLGCEAGARTIGLATNEREGGVDEIKRERLIKAGADIIVGDFLEKETLLAFLGL